MTTEQTIEQIKAECREVIEVYKEHRSFLCAIRFSPDEIPAFPAKAATALLTLIEAVETVADPTLETALAKIATDWKKV
jgi:hypothetical protein